MVWPIVAEQRKAHRLAKEANKPISWKEAWKLGKANATKTKVSKNGKKYNPYVVQGIANFALGLAGGICLKNVINKLSGDGTSVTAEAIKAGKHAWRLSRALTPAAAQMGDAGIMFISDRHDETNRKRAAQTAVGALITAGIGVTALEISEALAENAQLTAEPTLPEQTTTAVISDPTDSLRTGTAAADSLSIQEPVDMPQTGSNPTIDSINEVYIDDNSLAPSAYSPDLGISKGHWAWLDHFVGKERLQRQWLNLSKNNVMDHFGGRSKAETIYDINKLWSFGRKSFSVFGDKEGLYYINNLKEKVRIDDPELITKFRSMLASGVRPTIDSPYGADFLRSHFEALNLQGIDADKMDQLVSDTFKLTYENQSVIREHIKELLPDADKSTLNKMTAIVVENRRFYENGKELEAARMLLDCGPEGKTYDYDGINKLLDRTQEILKTGNRPAQLETLKTDCPTDDDTVIHGLRKVIKTENKVVQTPVDPIDARTIPAEVKSAPKLRAIVPPKSPAQLPNQEVTIGEVHRMTGDSRAAINGTGATVSEDATQTTSGQNHLRSNGYVYE